MLCESCGSDNPEGRSFCGKCGVQLGVACDGCGAFNGLDQHFCGGCGKSLHGRTAAATIPAAGVAPAQPAARRALPESIANGRYRVRRLLGEGSSKIVYLAYDQALDRDVAISL